MADDILKEKLGIKDDSHVVLYDTIGVFASPRGAFTFKSEFLLLRNRLGMNRRYSIRS